MNRILGGANERNKLNTIQNCIAFCSLNDFSYAGVENEDQCYCGKNAPTQDPISDSECDSKCPGDQTKICGGDFAINVYSVPAASTTGNLFLHYPCSNRYKVGPFLNDNELKRQFAELLWFSKKKNNINVKK